jgi:cytochrome c oxidase subunit 4
MSDVRQASHSWWLWRAPGLTWLSLLVLFGVSLGSSFLPLGNGNIALNLFVAIIMIVLLASFLMDLNNAKALIRVIAAAGLFWLILMFALTFSDYLSRYY